MHGTAVAASVAATTRAGRERARGHDLLLIAASLTFYATLAAVPTALVAIRAATVVSSGEHVMRLAHSLARALPAHAGAPGAVLELFRRGVDLSTWAFLIALLPASLYGEGLRRALCRFGGVEERLTGWRGRLSIAPLLLIAPGLLLALLTATPWLNELFGHGGWPAVAGVVIAFTTDWLVLSPPWSGSSGSSRPTRRRGRSR